LGGQGVGKAEGRRRRTGGEDGSGCQGTGSTTELDRKHQPFQQPSCGSDAVEPLGSTQAEGERERMLGQASAHAQCVRVARRQGGERRRCAPQVSQQRLDGVPGHQHQRRIQHVLAGQGGVNRLPGPDVGTVQGRDVLAEVGQHRDHGVAAALGAAGDIGGVVAACLCSRGHDGGGTGRRQARLLQHGSPAGLDGEDRREHCPVPGQRSHQRRRRDGAQQADVAVGPESGGAVNTCPAR
jgi:hypothetical protein